MRQITSTRIVLLATTAAACVACSSMSSIESTEPTAAYGDKHTVEVAIGAIKSQGKMDRLSSRAIRLPEQPLGEIVVFGYRFPATCGAHEFRVYEAKDLQVLEYQYALENGDSHTIRDYVTGPSPFVAPGLWSAYDHTADSISTMTSELAERGDGLFKGVYSRGLVTGLPDREQRTLGYAYEEALKEVSNCPDTQSFAHASAD